MNKIKIVNPDITQMMQNTAKQFEVSNDSKINYLTSKRPKTPHQIFKSVIKEAAEAELQYKKTQRLRTTASNINRKPQKWEHKYQPQLSVLQKKFFGSSQKKARPSTVDQNRKTNKLKIQKHHEQEDINQLKLEITKVFVQYQAQKTLQKLRLKNRHVQYGFNKFGKYWNNHRVNLSKKNILDINTNKNPNSFINIMSK